MAKKAAKKATKKTARKTTTRKAAAPAAKRTAKITAASAPRRKGEIYNVIAEQTELTRKQVVSVFDSLSEMLAADLSKKGPKIALIPGLAKIVVQHKPATKARKGINPFTGLEATFKAKPARSVVKVRALKSLKDMA